MNAKLENDLRTVNGYVIRHYGVDDQQWGKHDPKRRWQRHAKYAMGRPDPNATRSKNATKAGAQRDTNGGNKKDPDSLHAKASFKRATKEKKAIDDIDAQIKKLQEKREVHKKAEQDYRARYERDKTDDRSVRRKQADLRREQKARYKEHKRKVAEDTYKTIKRVMKRSKEEISDDIRSNAPIEVRAFKDRVHAIGETIRRKKASVRTGVARFMTFRSALLVDKALSKQMFNKSMSKNEYKTIYNETRDLFKKNFGDDIADIMRPKL